MASLNQCNFIGNVGKIKTGFMSNNEVVTNISLAVNENYKNKNGEKVEKTEWVQCVIYRKLAEIAGEYVKVGAPLYLSGKLQTRKWQDKGTGQDRYTTEIIVNEMKMLGSKDHNLEQTPQAATHTSSDSAEPAKKFDDEFKDDIPF